MCKSHVPRRQMSVLFGRCDELIYTVSVGNSYSTHPRYSCGSEVCRVHTFLLGDVFHYTSCIPYFSQVENVGTCVYLLSILTAKCSLELSKLGSLKTKG